MKKLPLILAIINILFVIHFTFISGKCYTSTWFEYNILFFNVEYNYWPFFFLPLLPVVFYFINVIFKIKTSYNILTIILIIINIVLFHVYAGSLSPY